MNLNQQKFPNSWSLVPLQEILIFNPKHSKDLDDNLDLSFVPMAAVSAEVGEITASEIRKLVEVRKGYCHIADGDVIFAKITPCMENGKCAIASNLINGIGCGSTEFYVLRSGGAILPQYLYRFLRQQSYRDFASQNMTGVVGQRRVPRQFMQESCIPLPPLNEQRRIVAKIEELTDRTRKAREALEDVPQLIEQFRRSVLAAAFRGDLTADWREQNPDAEPHENFSTFEKNHIGWAVGLMKDACLKVQSGSTPKGKPFTNTGEIPFLKVYNIVNQEIDFQYKPQYVSREIHENELRRSITIPGDVLMNIVGPPLGKIALVTDDFEEWNINQAIVNFRPKTGLISEFLYYFLCDGKLVQDVINETKGIVGQVNISLTQCRESTIAIPSVNEQIEIIQKIRSSFSLIESAANQSQECMDKVQQLDRAILAKAFRGELVPQDPTDEPASQLLQRIRRDREKTNPKQTPTTKRTPRNSQPPYQTSLDL